MVSASAPDKIRSPGSAGAAWAYPDFRRIWRGSFASNVGTWMQNVLLGPFCYKLADRTGGVSPATFVGLITVAQLSPLLLSPVGGLLGDRFRRRPFLIACQIEQLVMSLVLAALVSSTNPSKVALFITVLGIGLGNALNAPAWAALLPSLVGKENVAGAVSLNSTVINGSRVIGPLIALMLRDVVGVSTAQVFVINAVTYLFVIYPLLRVTMPPRAIANTGERIRDQLLAGLRVARQNRLVGRILLVLTMFSLLCLPYVGQFSAVAERGFHIDSDAALFRWFYATWGLGACLGGLSTATVFARLDKRVTARKFLIGFSVTMALFALMPIVLPGVQDATDTNVFAQLNDIWPAFPVAFALGFCYFGITTSMLTVLQTHIDESVRARVMALWFMAFGGTVPFGSMWGGLVIDAAGVSAVLFVSAAAALALAFAADFLRLSLEAHRLGLVE
jgi:MFS family permease